VLVGRINEHCAAAELEPLRVLSDLYASARQLLATLPETDHFGPRDTVEYIGPLYSSDYGTAVAWPARVREDVLRVFVYLQPAKINSDLLKALRDMEAQVIAVLPGATPEAITRISSEQVQVYVEPVKLAGLLEQADFVITNAGHGLVAATLLAGKPMLLIPQNYEQTLLAKRIEVMGAAQVLPEPLQVGLDATLTGIQVVKDDGNALQIAESSQIKYANAQRDISIGRVVSGLSLAVYQSRSGRDTRTRGIHMSTAS